MNRNSLALLEVIVSGMAAMLGFVTAVFTALACMQTKSDLLAVQNWFHQKWMTVSRSRWLDLPERVIRWFLEVTAAFKTKSPQSLGCWALLSILAVLIWTGNIAAARRNVAVPVKGPILYVLRLPITDLLSFVVLVGTSVILCVTIYRRSSMSTNRILGCGVVSIGLGTAQAALSMMPLLLSLSLPLAKATILIILMLPFCAGFWAIGPVYFEEKIGDYFDEQIAAEVYRDRILIGFTLAFSFSYTLLCLVLSRLVNPSADIPQSLQTLVSNAVFDVLTMTVTFRILKKSVSPLNSLSIPVAILMCLLLAGVLAIASLWCGLCFTSRALSLSQIGNVFVARSLDGTRWEIGPYFLIMHSTFIPILIYLATIIFCWAGKVICSLVTRFLRKGREPDINPFGLTAGAFGVMAAVFTLLAYLTHLLQGINKLLPAEVGVKSFVW
jgi:hypothetical protein